MVVFCPSCGSRISVEPASPGGDVTCPRCQSKFATAGLKPADNAPPPRRFKPKKSGGGKLGGVLIALGVLILLGGGAAALYFTGVFGLHTNATGTGTASQPTWQDYTSTEGRFSVLFPGTPTRELVRAPGRSGKVLATTFTAEAAGTTYSVAFEDFDGKQTPEQVIDQSRADLSAGKGGKLVKEKDVTAGDHKGKEFVADVPNRGKTYMRFFVAGNRLYKVMAVGTGKGPGERDVVKFMDSFRITG